MTYAIEKGVPWHGRVHHKFPLADMQEGDSFLIPKTDYKKANEMMRVLRIEYERYQASHPRVWFKHKQTDEGIRVWRTL